jgi:pyruvate formate lyase activating enzyme
MIKYLDIQRMSSEDGPGLRTTLFLKGCPLSCEWCHNPESISFKNQVVWNRNRCIDCKDCEKACATKAVLGQGACTGCLSCCEACPTGAREPKGKDANVQDLLRELSKDIAYFGTDGGVTLSGGEALAQAGSVELLKVLKNAGIGTAVDTCGAIPSARLKEALPFVDICLYDLKLRDSAAHKRFTGMGNELVIENLKLASDWAEQGGRLWIRTPVIPGATDTIENIKGIASLVKTLPRVERWELCAFNNLCASKYESLGLNWKYKGARLIAKEAMLALQDMACQVLQGVPVKIQATGSLRMDEEEGD